MFSDLPTDGMHRAKVTTELRRSFRRSKHVTKEKPMNHVQRTLQGLFLVGIFLLLPSISWGATQTAASCSLTDVAAAIAASSDGDTVLVPAGTCTWGTGRSYLAINKSITLQGSGIDGTIINLAADAPSYGNGTIGIVAKNVTVKGFTINAPSGTTYATAFSVGGNNFRISGNKYVGTTGTCTGYFVYFGAVYGVIDNNQIIGSTGRQELIFGRGPTNAWQTDNSVGGADNIFIEDNTLSNAGYLTDCNSNSKCVVRYNTISSPSKIDGHGKCTNTPERSVRNMEIYGNHWTLTSGYFSSIEVRGGTGTIFYNKSDNSAGASWLGLVDYATFQDICKGYAPNCGCPDAYPLHDQIGVGKDPKSAASEPYYLWNNRRASNIWLAETGGGKLPTSPCRNDDKCGPTYTSITQIQNNRDYYDFAPTFDGTSGTGCGTIESRPSTCTTGVAYWATNQSCSDQTGLVGANPTTPIAGTLYKCTAPNTWTAAYTPYTYPHPLRDSSPKSVLTPPKNLMVQ